MLENRPQGGSVGVRQIQTSPILKQLKSIKVALWAQFVITGGIALGRCVIVYFTDLAEQAFFGDTNREVTAPQDMKDMEIEENFTPSKNSETNADE